MATFVQQLTGQGYLKVLTCRLLIWTLVLCLCFKSGHAQQQAVLQVSPSQSKVTYNSTGTGIKLDISPSSVQVTGNITLQILSYRGGSPRRPLEYTWVSSALTTYPRVLQLVARLPVGDVHVAQVTAQGLIVDGAHGPFRPEANTGNFAFTPSNATVTLSRINGTVGGNNVNNINFKTIIPTAVLPKISGRLTGVGGRIYLSASSSPSIVLRNVLKGTPYEALVGDTTVSFNVTVAANSSLALPAPAPGPAPVAAPGPAGGPGPSQAPGPAPSRPAPGPR